jgi:hypothetical protein
MPAELAKSLDALANVAAKLPEDARQRILSLAAQVLLRNRN